MPLRTCDFLLALVSLCCLTSGLFVAQHDAEGRLQDRDAAPAAGARTGPTDSDADKDLQRPMRIVGGSPAAQGEFPWQVSLRLKVLSSMAGYERRNKHPRKKAHGQKHNAKGQSVMMFHFCGGTLINPLWVVTAAHCTLDRHPWELVVVAGTVNLNDDTAPTYRVTKIIRHNYDKAKKENDIALLKISPFVVTGRKESQKVKPVEIPSPTFKARGTCTVSGWGFTQYRGSLSTQLLATDVEVLSDQECQARLTSRHLYPSMLCAGGGDKDACAGDSGGPLVCRQGNSTYLAGIVSFGIGCATPHIPGVYTEVAYYSRWIMGNVQKNSDKTELRMLRHWLGQPWAKQEEEEQHA